MIILALSTLLAWTTGFAIKQGNICAVAALHQWIAHEDATHFRTLITGMCCAALVLLGTVWWLPNAASVAPEFPVTFMTVSGGVLFGIGAWLNGACVLGTVAHLSRGDTNYLATVVGMFIAALVVRQIYNPVLLFHATTLGAPTGAAISVACFYALVIAYERWKHYRCQPYKGARGSDHHRQDLFSMIAIVGMCCGALHALNGEWTYLAAADRLAQRLVSTSTDQLLIPTLLYAFATLTGGLTSAWHRGELKIVAPTYRYLCQRLIGGFMMGSGACLIPGGNESMMFYGIPSLASQAIVAYVTMTLTLSMIIRLQSKLTRIA